ncbi:MAG TPA: biopolymer transporter ExbD, partial [Planctomycetaceae bacterium]|nr:biopolymer transporter ExbD [Planctomycetaceae bacterium]
EGVISVSNQVLSLAALEESLIRARENYPNQMVVIRGAGEGRYQPVMDVMSTCRRAGIRNISLAHRPLGEAP